MGENALAVSRAKLHRGVQQTQHKQPVKRGDCPAVFGVCAVSPAILPAVVDLTI